MKINDLLSITKRTRDNAFYGENMGRTYVIVESDPNYATYSELYDIFRNTQWADRPAKLVELSSNPVYAAILGTSTSTTDNRTLETAVPLPPKTPKEKFVDAVQHLMDFFTEFSFVPSFRFVNTFGYMCINDADKARAYVNNYFALMDSSYAKEVSEKVNSAEFTKIINAFVKYIKAEGISNPVNTRFKVYYGSAGTGKTTLAQSEADNRCIVCNSSMLPSDLMEDFIFKDGNPDFNPSLLWDCMEKGQTIVLDEINLLPFDSLRFLQGIVDGKTEFYYKNRPVHIKEGFQIIGTMNLSLGGMVYGLPEPLVDRCCETREFVLTAQQLATAIYGMETEEAGE